jgi:hypothetical protein
LLDTIMLGDPLRDQGEQRFVKHVCPHADAESHADHRAANRVFPGKHSGVIVDYANVSTSLEKALAIYGAGKGGANPVKDKQALVAELRRR